MKIIQRAFSNIRLPLILIKTIHSITPIWIGQPISLWTLNGKYFIVNSFVLFVNFTQFEIVLECRFQYDIYLFIVLETARRRFRFNAFVFARRFVVFRRSVRIKRCVRTVFFFPYTKRKN